MQRERCKVISADRGRDQARFQVRSQSHAGLEAEFTTKQPEVFFVTDAILRPQYSSNRTSIETTKGLSTTWAKRSSEGPPMPQPFRAAREIKTKRSRPGQELEGHDLLTLRDVIGPPLKGQCSEQSERYDCDNSTMKLAVIQDEGGTIPIKSDTAKHRQQDRV